MQLAHKTNLGPEAQTDLFMQGLGSLHRQLQTCNVQNELISDRALDHFKSLAPQHQMAVIDKLNSYNDLLLEIVKQGVSLKDTQGSLWKIFKMHGWLPDSGLLSEISESDVVEIYMPDNTQLYRNANYFKCTSYSLSDLLVFPWNELVEHGSKPTEQILEIGKQIFFDQIPATTRFRMDPYLAKEKYSKLKHTARLESKFLAPVKSKDTQRNEAALVVWNIEIVDEPSPLLRHPQPGLSL